ncbi:MAG TPA: HIT domain-containing protein [Mycobacteriales bacterium]|jgi:histidine triad (HIT) family protein|nr:HIT domain-containing protein [Mycobacteriales bacterium]
MPSDCLFCRIVAGEIPATVVHETDRVLAFRDIDPKAPIHVLVIPKAHAETIGALARSDAAAAGEVVAAASLVAEQEGVADGWRLVANNGAPVGQTVFHAHLHVLGGGPIGEL